MMLVACWRHALRSEWPFIIIIIKTRIYCWLEARSSGEYVAFYYY